VGHASNKAGESPRLNFIIDQVADEDAFGSHTRTAKAIASLIQQDPGIKTVGLIGPWGSGKSTVIKLIEAEFSRNAEWPKSYFFKYDAWLLQSDPPKRAFLETLIQFLIDQKITKRERWDISLKELHRQIEDTETTNTPQISIFGALLAASAFCSAIGLQFIAPDWIDKLKDSNAVLLDRILFEVRWILTLSPAIFLIIWIPTKMIISMFQKSKPNFSEMLAIFSNHQITTVKQRTVRSPDPTTIEFQARFREIMDEVSKHGRFIFVIDNLDRLPADDAVELWATIRSFFLGSGAKKVLPTVIVPIDKDAVERMYNSAHPTEWRAKEIADSFMDKTFDVKFHVSTPIISDWAAYLDQRMNHLFANHFKPEWAIQTQTILDRWLNSSVENSAPKRELTPRSINTLLNAIGALWLQWHDCSEIQFASIVYFALHRDQIGQDIVAEVSKHNSALEEFDSSWQRSISALYFNVEPKTANQLLLETPILQSVKSYELEKFLTLSQIPGFWIIFSRIIKKSTISDIFFSVTNAIRLCHVVEITTQTAPAGCWGMLRRLYIQKESKIGLHEYDVEAFSIVIENCPDEELVSFIDKSSSVLSDRYTSANNVSEFSRFINIIVKKCNEKNLGVPKFYTNDHGILYLEALKTADLETLNYLHTNINEIDLINIIIDRLEKGENWNNIYKILKNGKFDFGIFQWIDLCNWASIQLNQNDNVEIAAKILGFLFTRHSEVRHYIAELSRNSVLTSRFNDAYYSNQNSVAAVLVALMIVSEHGNELGIPDGTDWGAACKSRNGLADQINQSLIEFDADYGLQEYAWSAHEWPVIRPLMKIIASQRFKNEDLKLPKPTDAGEDFEYYASCLEDDLRVQFASKVGLDDEFWVAFGSLDILDHVNTYYTLLDEGCDALTKTAKFVDDKLKGLSIEQWRAAMHHGDEPLGIACALKTANPKTQITGRLATALRKEIPSVRESTDPQFLDRWFALADLLSTSDRKTNLKNLADELTSGRAVGNLVSLLNASERILLREGEFTRDADGSARHIIVYLLDNSGFSFLFENSDLFVSIVGNCTNETRLAINDSLNNLRVRNEGSVEDEHVDILVKCWKLDSE